MLCIFGAHYLWPAKVPHNPRRFFQFGYLAAILCVCLCVCVWALLPSTVKQRRSPAGTENCAKASKKFAHVIDTGSIEVGEK